MAAPAQRVVIGDFRTGRNILDLETSGHNWENRRNAPDDLSCTVDLADPAMRALGLRNAAAPGKTYLAILLGDHVMAYGLIGQPHYDKPSRSLKLRAVGVGSYYRRRRVLPLAALTQPLIDPATGEPNPATNTLLSGWDLGTILKKIIQQSMLWVGGNLPITFEADRAGTHEDEILGSSLTPIATVLDNYADRDNGPDWEFSPRLAADRKGIELLFRTGTEAQPRLRSATVHQFDYSVPEPSIDDLVTELDSDDMTGLAWTTGGRETGVAIVAVSSNTDLTDDGYPLFESVDSDHSNASDISTLQSYSDETVRINAAPTEYWSFRIRTDAPPLPGEYRVGDLCDVHVTDDDFIPDGTYRREIATLAGTEDPDWITVTTTEATLG